MILLAGIPSEAPLRMVAEALGRISVPYVVLNQREFSDAEITLELTGEHPSGRMRLEDRSYPLELVEGIYHRLMDDRLLPELADEPGGSSRRIHCRRLHEALARWVDLAPGRVVNRNWAMASNSSKPYQSQLIDACGFATPETLITDDPAAVVEFADRHGRTIFKSISGQRSIVKTLAGEDYARLEAIRACPVMFQRYIPGMDIRVHTVGERVFATEIGSSATDYRYAHLEGDHAQLRPFEPGEDLAERCVELSRSLGLDFAGIDLRRTAEGEVYCLEVNPCPAFSYYEAHTGQPIAEAVALHLAGR
jgi:ribosomal protein S6-L-glutamate ligase RimK-like protein